MRNKDPKLTYALKSGILVHIDSVESGNACNCICPKCQKSLCAKKKRKLDGHQSHFAHSKDSDCHGYYMTTLHLLAEQIIQEEKAVMAPAYKEIKEQRLSFKKIEVDQRNERKDLQPDVVGETDDGLRWFIEIRNTHEVDEVKKKKLIESNITCLEIDVSGQTLENLRSFLLESVESREWINNPIYESQIAEAERKRELREKEERRKKVFQVERFFEGKKELIIPAYDNYKSNKIYYNNVSVSKSDDGLQAKVKVGSSDGIPYIFIIGSHEIIKNNIISEQEYECNVLAICSDHIPLDSRMPPYFLDIRWLHHLESAKIQEKKYYAYKNNPNYKLTPKVDCICTICEDKPFEGACNYSEETISFKGKEYVACNIAKRNKDKVVTKKRGESNTIVEGGIQSQNSEIKEWGNTELVSNHSSNMQPKVLPQAKQLPENLSLDLDVVGRTINEYYDKLKSEGYYETMKGDRAEIVECAIKNSDKFGAVIIILYKSTTNKRNLYPYNIEIIKVNDSGKINKSVIPFTNYEAALESYNSRISR